MRALERALAELEAGRPIVMPTDTVYGLGALAGTPGGVEAIFRLKGRPGSKPIPVLVPGIDALASVAAIDRRARLIAERFWPGPLTVVLPRAPGFDAYLGGEEGAGVAVRIPDDDLALAILSGAGALAVTSANRSGGPAATTAAEARAVFGREVAAYVDGGRRGGTASTVVSLVGEPEILRVGPVTLEEVLSCLSAGGNSGG